MTWVSNKKKRIYLDILKQGVYKKRANTLWIVMFSPKFLKTENNVTWKCRIAVFLLLSWCPLPSHPQKCKVFDTWYKNSSQLIDSTVTYRKDPHFGRFWFWLLSWKVLILTVKFWFWLLSWKEPLVEKSSWVHEEDITFKRGRVYLKITKKTSLVDLVAKRHKQFHQGLLLVSEALSWPSKMSLYNCTGSFLQKGRTKKTS